MIPGILIGVWLVGAVVTFAVLFDPEDWHWAIGFAAMWPIVLAIAIVAVASGELAELREKIRGRLR